MCTMLRVDAIDRLVAGRGDAISDVDRSNGCNRPQRIVGEIGRRPGLRRFRVGEPSSVSSGIGGDSGRDSGSGIY